MRKRRGGNIRREGRERGVRGRYFWSRLLVQLVHHGRISAVVRQLLPVNGPQYLICSKKNERQEEEAGRDERKKKRRGGKEKNNGGETRYSVVTTQLHKEKKIGRPVDRVTKKEELTLLNTLLSPLSTHSSSSPLHSPSLPLIYL